MKTNNKNIIFGILLGLCITVIIISIKQYIQIKDFEIQDSNVEVPEIYHHLNSLTISNFENKVSDKEDFIVYIGRPDCGDCQLFEPQFIKLINNHKFEDIWYLNVKKFREENPEKWNYFKEQYEFSQTPAIIHFSNGSIQDLIEWENNKGLPQSDLKEWLMENL
ncbi:thioredoxin family protein [Paenibacillus solani]|uniref:thioredoxin family protein n=1 Tax=Paenibacillus solani TaxID=1705565 RepID=UPI003D2D8623